MNVRLLLWLYCNLMTSEKPDLLMCLPNKWKPKLEISVTRLKNWSIGMVYGIIDAWLCNGYDAKVVMHNDLFGFTNL